MYPKEVADFIRDFEPAPYASLDEEGVLKIKKIIAKDEEKSKKLWEKIRGARAVMQTMCMHGDFQVESKYHSGDYYNKAYTDYTVKCGICGCILHTTDKNHNTYG